jgi:hypothetical protein
LNVEVKEDELGMRVQMGERRNACRDLVGKPKGKRPLGKSKPKWEDNKSFEKHNGMV